jgi:hypothetical protein
MDFVAKHVYYWYIISIFLTDDGGQTENALFVFVHLL